jgi:hypothetical protein
LWRGVLAPDVKKILPGRHILDGNAAHLVGHSEVSAIHGDDDGHHVRMDAAKQIGNSCAIKPNGSQFAGCVET